MNKTLGTPEENLKRSNSSYSFKVTITLYDKLVLKDQKKTDKKKILSVLGLKEKSYYNLKLLEMRI